MGGKPASVRALTLSNMNISATSGRIATQFYLKHHGVGERLHQVFGQIGLELWFPWQQIAPIWEHPEIVRLQEICKFVVVLLHNNLLCHFCLLWAHLMYSLSNVI